MYQLPRTAEDRANASDLELSAAETMYLAIARDYIDDLTSEEKETVLQCGYRILQNRKRLNREGGDEGVWLAAHNCKARLEAVLLRRGELYED